MKKLLLATFNKETQKEIIDTLKVYDKCQVAKYTLTGREEVFTGVVIKASYTEEEKTAVFFDLKAEDLFTPKERNQNYRETFGYDRYPQYQ